MMHQKGSRLLDKLGTVITIKSTLPMMEHIVFKLLVCFVSLFWPLK
jgi:hypothetical protein